MKNHSIVTSCLLLACLAACGPVATPPAIPTPSLSPTNTSMPSVTLEVLPTATATETAIPLPPTVTPTIAPPSLPLEYLSDVRVLYFDPFDTMDRWGWDPQMSATVDGVFHVRGASFWNAGLILNEKIMENDGLILKFKVANANGRSEFVIDSGVWNTGTFRQFGIYNSRLPTADLFRGPNAIGGAPLNGSLALKPDTWYGLLMAIDQGGKFLAVIWDPAQESHRIVYKESLGKDWAGLVWSFFPRVDAGETLFCDDFYRIVFGKIK